MVEQTSTSVDRMVLPDGFDELAPGPELAVLLAGLDKTRLNGFDLVRVTQAEYRQSAHYQAGMYSTLAELRHAAPGAEEAPAVREPWKESHQVEVAIHELSLAL